MSLLSSGAVYKGELDMFGSKFVYVFKFTEFTPSGVFHYSHQVYNMGMLADDKDGDGRFEHIDADNAKIFYTDPETSFEGTVNLNTGAFNGTATQISQLFSGTQGEFKLAFDKFE
jgi:hypothetical protein